MVPTPDGGTALLLSVGSETGFDLCFNEASRTVLRSAASHLTSAKAEPGSRLQAAFEAATRALREVPGGNGPEDAPSCSLLAVLSLGAQAQAAWVGMAEACLVRGGEIVARTEGHSWLRARREEGTLTPGELIEHPLRRVATRALNADPRTPSAPPEISNPWTLAPGDAIALCTATLLERVRPGELASVATRRPPSEAARALVDRAGTAGAIAAIVARVEGRAFIHSNSMKRSRCSGRGTRQVSLFPKTR